MKRRRRSVSLLDCTPGHLSISFPVSEAGFDMQSLMRSTAFEERQKVEVLKEFNAIERVKYAFWMNPTMKGGRRIKPVEFPQLKVSIEIPRQYI